MTASGDARPRTRPGLSAWLLPIACLISLAALARAQTATPTIDSVVRALRSNENARALSLCQQLARAHPDDPRAWTLEGMALQSLGRTAESLRAFEHALRIDPNNVAALEAAAQLEFKLASPKAEPFLEKLIRLNPKDQTSHAMMGALAFKRKDCTAAVAHFQKSPQVISNSAPALAEYGVCLFRLDRYPDALPVFQRLRELRSDDEDAVYNLGLAQYRAHQYADVVHTLLPLAQGDAGNARALNLIAAAYEANQQTPQAVAALQRAIALAPRDIDNYLDLATISLDHGAFKVGVDVANAGLRVLPNSAPLYLVRGVLEVQMDQFDPANSDFRRAETLDPHQNYSSVAQGISLLQENKLDQSVQVVKRRLAKAPNDPVLNYLLAELYIRKGVGPGTASFQEAIAAAHRALRSEPGFNLAEDDLAELYLRSGKVALAEAVSRHALQTDPSDQSAIYHLITCLRREGKPKAVPQLVQRLAKITSVLRQEEAARNRFKLVEKGVAPLRPESQTESTSSP